MQGSQTRLRIPTFIGKALGNHCAFKQADDILRLVFKKYPLVGSVKKRLGCGQYGLAYGLYPSCHQGAAAVMSRKNHGSTV